MDVIERTKQYYERAIVENPNDSDYRALHQAQRGTLERHSAIAEALGDRIVDADVLDLGCGTGLILTVFHQMHCTPRRYCGVDFLPDHQELAKQRCLALGVAPAIIIDEIGHFLGSLERRYDVAIACGVMGFPPFHSVHRFWQLVTQMVKAADAGGITIPIYDMFSVGDEQMYFAEEDVTNLVNLTKETALKMTYQRVGKRGALIYWK